MTEKETMNNKHLIEKNIPVYVDSAYGENLSSDGGSFSVQYNPGIQLPKETKLIEVSCIDAAVQYTFPNLSKNSTDYFGYSFRGTSYLHEIPQGIYSLSEVEDYMNRMAAEDGIYLDDDLFSLIGIEATQKVAIGAWINDGSGTVTIDFTDSSGTTALRELLGYDTGTVSYTASGQTSTYLYEEAENQATFDSLHYVQIECSLITNGVAPGGTPSTTLCTIVPDVDVGSQIIYSPMNPLKFEQNNLAGQNIRNISYRLVDNNGEQVNTMGNDWSLRMNIRCLHEV